MSRTYSGFVLAVVHVNEDADVNATIDVSGTVRLTYRTSSGDLSLTLDQGAFMELRATLSEIEEHIQCEPMPVDGATVSLSEMRELNEQRHQRHVDSLRHG